MPVSGGGFGLAYNVQAAVDTITKLIVTTHKTQQPNDKLELEPTLENRATLPIKVGAVTELVAGSGYFSENNVTAGNSGRLLRISQLCAIRTISRCGSAFKNLLHCRTMRTL